MNNHIKKYRKLKKITQQDLADFVGVSRQTINNIEQNIKSPSIDLAKRIALTLDVSVDELFKEERMETMYLKTTILGKSLCSNDGKNKGFFVLINEPKFHKDDLYISPMNISLNSILYLECDEKDFNNLIIGEEAMLKIDLHLFNTKNIVMINKKTDIECIQEILKKEETIKLTKKDLKNRMLKQLEEHKKKNDNLLEEKETIRKNKNVYKEKMLNEINKNKKID